MQKTLHGMSSCWSLRQGPEEDPCLSGGPHSQILIKTILNLTNRYRGTEATLITWKMDA